MADTVAADTLLGGRYRLHHQLARGGMAMVWEAEDTVLGRRVAVKILHPHLGVEPAVRERFRREGVAVARLSHPSVVAVYDTGEDGDIAYLIMELVDGPSLREILAERGTLPVSDAVDIVVQVAAGLGVAHERGIIHRDVKPANILVMGDGRAKLTDFGIARGEAGTDLDEDLTRTGTIIGTAKYLAPEQVTGSPVDARTDVYALGLVLYEVLCGRAAYEADTEVGTAVARTQGAPLAPRQLRVDIPRRLEAVTMRALATDPDARFASAAELRAALLALGVEAEHDTPPVGLPLPQGGDRRYTVGVVGVLVVGLVVGLLGFFFAATETGRSVLERVRDRLPGGDTAEPLAITGAADFDPFGNDRAENPELVALAHDGDPATAWRTTRYNTPSFGNLKPGVGIRFDLARAQGVDRLTVEVDGTPWAAEVYIGDGTASTLDAWGAALDSGAQLGRRATFDLRNRQGSSVLLWITHLPDGGELGVVEVGVAG